MKIGDAIVSRRRGFAVDALARSYGAALGFGQCWSRGTVEGGAGEELGAVRLEQRGTWRLGHGAAVSTGTAVQGVRRGLRRAGLSSGGTGVGRVAAHGELGAAW